MLVSFSAGIANSIDLTERTLPFLEQRGCAPQRVHFHPYSTEQLIVILKHRLSQNSSADTQQQQSSCNRDSGSAMLGDNLWGVGFNKVVVEPFAIEFCAKKVEKDPRFPHESAEIEQ